ncbi:hypothetical protein J7643_14920 [bacterium]|nr:hypothetical protein [bacterium]
MFEPDPELVSTHRVAFTSGEAIVFDQSLWGKVIEVRELHQDGGRYYLDDYVATSKLRQLLEAATIEGVWAFPEEHALCCDIRTEVRTLIETLFGDWDTP